MMIEIASDRFYMSVSAQRAQSDRSRELGIKAALSSSEHFQPSIFRSHVRIGQLFEALVDQEGHLDLAPLGVDDGV